MIPFTPATFWSVFLAVVPAVAIAAIAILRRMQLVLMELRRNRLEPLPQLLERIDIHLLETQNEIGATLARRWEDTEWKRIPRTAAVYARCDEEVQDRDGDMQLQLNEARRVADREGLTIVKIFQESAADENTKHRPKFNILTHMLNRDRFDVLIVYDLGTLSRDPEELFPVVDNILRRPSDPIHLITLFPECYTRKDGWKWFDLIKVTAEEAHLSNEANP